MTDSQSPAAPEPTPREQRRTQLLDAARVCFTEHGYAATPVSAIVKAAGVSQGTFYLYFQSKEDVLADLRRAVFRDYERSLVAVAALDAPADERLARAIVAMGDAVTRNRAMEQVFRAAERGESTVLDGRTRLARNAVAFLVEGARSKAFHAEDPELVAHFVVTLFDEVLFPAVMSERPAPLARVVEQGVRFTLRALGVAPARVEAVVAKVLAPPLETRAAPPSPRDLPPPCPPSGGHAPGVPPDEPAPPPLETRAAPPSARDLPPPCPPSGGHAPGVPSVEPAPPPFEGRAAPPSARDLPPPPGGGTPPPETT